MAASTEYRRYAQACLEIAERACDERVRAILIKMAQVWFRLAEKNTILPENPLEATE